MRGPSGSAGAPGVAVTPLIDSVLALIAQDLVSAPSSQAFVERLFSVCGML